MEGCIQPQADIQEDKGRQDKYETPRAQHDYLIDSIVSLASIDPWHILTLLFPLNQGVRLYGTVRVIISAYDISECLDYRGSKQGNEHCIQCKGSYCL